MDELGGCVGVGDREIFEEGEEALEGERGDGGESEAVDAVVQRLGLEAASMADRAGLVAAVAGEQHADVHFVGFALEPAEVAVDAIPLAGFPGFGGDEAGFAFNDEVAVGLREAFESAVDIYPALAAVAQEVVLALGGLAALEGTNDAFGNRERGVGNDAMHVDADDAAEAFALRARAEGGVETEEAGRGRANVEIAGGAMPTQSVVIDPSGGGVDDGEAVVAESEGGFDRLGEAGGGSAGLKIDAVLNDKDFGGEFLEG